MQFVVSDPNLNATKIENLNKIITNVSTALYVIDKKITPDMFSSMSESELARFPFEQTLQIKLKKLLKVR